MKKLLCSIMAIVMMLTMVCPVMAADVTMGSSNIDHLFAQVKSYMMGTSAQERISVWKNFKALMVDGNNGIDILINAVDGVGIPALEDSLEPFFNGLQGEDAATKEAFKLLFKIYKAVPLANRVASLDLFGDDITDVTTEEIPLNKVTLVGDQITAANNIYELYVDSDMRGKFAEHIYQGGETLDADNFLVLLTALKGLFVMTDSAGGTEFVLHEYNKTFAENLASYIDATQINGVSVSTSPNAEAEGYDIICGFVKFFNSLTAKASIADLKTVLAHTDIALYEANQLAATRPTTSQGGGSILGGGGFGGGGSQKPPVEPDEPEEPDVPEVKFPDVVGHWAEDVIRDLADRGILAGYDDGNFKPDSGVTRQEIAVIMTRALGLEEKAAEYAAKDTDFADDANIAAWGRGAITLMIEMGIYTGYDDNEFKPNKTILRQELIAVVMRYAAMTEEGMKTVFDDSHEIHGYAESFIAHASELGIVNGYPDGTFKPLNNVTRAEAAKIIYGVIDYYKEIGKLN